MTVPRQFNPGEFWDLSTSVGVRPYNENYDFAKECTSLFRIRYRSYHAFICNGYSWEGLEQKGPWIEMEQTEFNERGGDRLIDMSSIYLIAKEKPTTMYTYNKKTAVPDGREIQQRQDQLPDQRSLGLFLLLIHTPLVLRRGRTQTAAPP